MFKKVMSRQADILVISEASPPEFCKFYVKVE